MHDIIVDSQPADIDSAVGSTIYLRGHSGAGGAGPMFSLAGWGAWWRSRPRVRVPELLWHLSDSLHMMNVHRGCKGRKKRRSQLRRLRPPPVASLRARDSVHAMPWLSNLAIVLHVHLQQFGW